MNFSIIVHVIGYFLVGLQLSIHLPHFPQKTVKNAFQNILKLKSCTQIASFVRPTAHKTKDFQFLITEK